MNISIFGLGYVGCVGAACCAKLGHKVIGVDVNENKVRLMNEGKPTIIEEGIAELCKEAHDKGLMSATTVAAEAVAQTEVSFIVVGTPSSKEGHLNLNYICHLQLLFQGRQEWLHQLPSVIRNLLILFCHKQPLPYHFFP